VIEDIKKDAEGRMKKSLDALEKAFRKVRTGRANPGLLDGLEVSYYGADTPLNQVANVSVEEGRTLVVTAFDKTLIPDIEKAILASDLGLNPSTAGSVIRLVMPPLTEETRKDLVKVVRGEAEGARVAIRNIRRDANSDLKELLKEKEISEDEEHRGEDLIQQLTDQMVGEVEKMLKEKEEELLTV
jgi:ribosome recycling factor